jgi:hypothetical protein
MDQKREVAYKTLIDGGQLDVPSFRIKLPEFVEKK